MLPETRDPLKITRFEFDTLVDRLPRDETFASEYQKLLIRLDSKYAETAHWTPVVIPQGNILQAIKWLIGEGHMRGDRESRNDWLHPFGELFLIRDPKVAVMLKLAKGGSL